MTTLLSIGSTTALADIKVVIAFDADGQRVSKMARSASLPKRIVGKSQRLTMRQRAATVDLPSGRAALHWFDSSGRMLDVEHIADPRIAHFPGPAAAGDELPSQPGGRVVLEAGALLVEGPDEAATLLVRLPDVPVPLLAAESWRFDLNEASVNNQD